jgi:hypothetical protein
MDRDEEDSTSDDSSQIPKDEVEESTMFGPQRFSSRMRKYKNESQKSKDTVTTSSSHTSEEAEEEEDDEEEEEEEDDEEEEVGARKFRMQEWTSQVLTSSSSPPSGKRGRRLKRPSLSKMRDSARKMGMKMATSFFWRHLALWIVLTLVLSGFFVIVVQDSNIAFIDCLYLVTSSITGS